MRKLTTLSLLVIFCAFSILFVSCKPTNEALDKTLTYLSLTKNAYEKVLSFGCPYLQSREDYETFVNLTDEIKGYWNLAIDALEVYMENKNPKSQEAITINLGQFKDLVTKVTQQFNLGDKYTLLLNGVIEASTILVQTLLPNVKVTESQGQSLDYLKITATCQSLPREVVKLDFSKAINYPDFPKAWKEYNSKY